MNEVSLKPVIEELENLFSKFNARFFADKLEKPVITVSPDHTRGAYGWCTGWKAWKAGEDEGHYEINLCAEYLNRDYVAEQAEKEAEAKQARKEWVWAMGKEMAHRLVDQYWGGQTNED